MSVNCLLGLVQKGVGDEAALVIHRQVGSNGSHFDGTGDLRQAVVAITRIEHGLAVSNAFTDLVGEHKC